MAKVCNPANILQESLDAPLVYLLPLSARFWGAGTANAGHENHH